MPVFIEITKAQGSRCAANIQGGLERQGSRRPTQVDLHRAVLVVGNPKEFEKPLSSLGPVKNIDITIPPPPAEKGQAQAEEKSQTAASNPEGKALAAKVAGAMGGLPKLKSIKTMCAIS